MSTDPPWRQPRTLAEFGGPEGLRPAERKLLEERDTGLPVVLGRGSLPPENAPGERRVRASFLRWLILGAEGAEGRTHEKGVQIKGAFIESDGPIGAETRGLDLEGCTVAQDIWLIACRFAAPPMLRSATLQGLRLNGSRLPALQADGLVTAGSVFLRHGFESNGAIRLHGARIGGDLSCTGAKLRNPGGNTLDADGLVTVGDVFLRHGFESDGAIRLLGARIGGDLDCGGSKLRNASGTALDASTAQVANNLFLRDGTAIEGVVDLRAARLGPISDALECWPATIKLDRCTYKAFVASPTDAATRIAWLDRDDREGGFKPQPWEQCARVLRETGHAEGARTVLIAKEKRQREARRAAMGSPVLRGLWAAWDRVLGATVRYGRRPTLAFAWLLGFWLLGAGVFWGASALDAIKPNNAFVLRAPEWVLCGVEAPQRVFLPSLRRIATGRAEPGESQRDCFEGEREAAQYPAFDPIVYSLDTLLPVVEMEMQAFWIPDERASWLGAAARVYLWLHIALGWALSLLAVAGFSGLVKSD